MYFNILSYMSDKIFNFYLVAYKSYGQNILYFTNIYESLFNQKHKREREKKYLKNTLNS